MKVIVILPTWDEIPDTDLLPLASGKGTPEQYKRLIQNGAYDRYEMEVAGTGVSTLEEVFHTLNVNHPADYMFRSMSVGDLAYLDGRWWLVDAYGWKNANDIGAVITANPGTRWWLLGFV